MDPHPSRAHQHDRRRHPGNDRPQDRHRRTPGRVLPLALALLLAVLGLGTTSPAVADWAPQDPTDPATPPTVTADALPTVQIDGVVWSQAMRGDVVYAGGEFTEARDPGAAVGAGEPRGNFVAFDVTTGRATGFAPDFNQQVRAVAVSPDQQRLFVGGDFTEVDGEPRSRFAAFDLTTGELLEEFRPQVNGGVAAIAVTDEAVYIGGAFGSVGNQTRGNLAALDADTGALLGWAPAVSGGAVSALTAKPDGSLVAAGGSFTAVNGDPGPETGAGDGLALFDAVTGAVRPLPAGEHIHNGNGEGDADGAITTLAADADAFYGAGYTYASIEAGTMEGTFAIKWDGTIRWVADCHGDSYSVHPQGDVVYVASHTHYCENMGGVAQGAGGVGDYPYYRAVAFSRAATGTATWEPDQRRYYNFEGQPTPSMQTWFPSINAGAYTGMVQGPWSVTGNDDYVVMGGEFTRVNGTNQQGLVRFATADLAPKDEGPTLFNQTYPLKATSTEPGLVRLSWATNEDIDNANLEYRLYRDEKSAAGRIATRTVRADFWNPLGMTFTDRDVQPGSTHRYQVEARDPGGRTASSAWVDVTVASSGAASPYTEAVHGDEPTHWWRFGEPSASTTPAEDAVGSNPLTLGAGVVRGTQGAVPSDTSNRGATFTGTTGSVATSTKQDSPPDLFTLEAWFRTTSTTGGRIVGRDTAATRGAKVDRQIYLTGAGEVGFGVKPNASLATVTSAGGYNDGRWHHTAAVLSKEGMKLYVDGAQVAQNPDVVVGEHLAVGYWRVGGGSTVAGLPGNFVGDIDEVAVYKHALSATDIAAHVAAAGPHGEPDNQRPTVSVGATVTGLSAAFTSNTADPDGQVVSYLWTFGDGATSPDPNPTHTYATGGSYTATLTVTDDRGAQSAAGVDIRPVLPPTADFTVTTDGLKATFTSTSTDPDGTLTAYRWEYGNGQSSRRGTAVQEYTYAVDGYYDVTLTVTDDDGETNTVTKRVTVGSPPPPPDNVPPTAGFTHAASGLAATFTSTATDADGSITQHAWDFGDGQSSAQTHPSHTYAAAGTYRVTLTVTDDDGASTSTNHDVTVAAQPSAPVASQATLTVRAKHAHRRGKTLEVRAGTKVVLSAMVRPATPLPLSGTVQILDRAKVVHSHALTGPETGARTVRAVLRRLAVGKHRLRVVYSGSPTTTGSESAVVIVRVVRRT